MKAGKSIEITLAPDGSCEIDAVGFSGASCVAATEFLEEALGKTGSRTRKPSYYRRARLKSQQRLGR